MEAATIRIGVTMGTRGAAGFVLDGKEYVSYNQYDSYPSGLGADVLEFAKQIAEVGVERAKEAVENVRLVNASDTPTPEEQEKFADIWDPTVSSGSDWYSLLRNGQGRLDILLAAGVMTDDADFLNDSLFCEYAYLINLDTETLEYYEGFQKDDEGNYGRVKLVNSFPLSNLPDNTEDWEDDDE